MLEIIEIMKKKKKTFDDFIKIFLFVFFTVLLIQYIGHLKPQDFKEGV